CRDCGLPRSARQHWHPPRQRAHADLSCGGQRDRFSTGQTVLTVPRTASPGRSRKIILEKENISVSSDVRGAVFVRQFSREASEKTGETIVTVALPTPDQLRAVADQCGLALTDEDVTSFRVLMQGSVDAYNPVAAI